MLANSITNKLWFAIATVVMAVCNKLYALGYTIMTAVVSWFFVSPKSFRSQRFFLIDFSSGRKKQP